MEERRGSNSSRKDITPETDKKHGNRDRDTKSNQSMKTVRGSGSGDPHDVNGPHFNPDMFIKKIIQDHPLEQILETEKKFNTEINDLDSQMQTLVYDNYNKFILATDTIRKMRSNFREMEDKMSLLSTNISKITSSSTQIASSLHEKREKVGKLSGINDLLKKLKFLFELPNNLKQHCEESNYEEAVKCYLDGLKFLNEFKRFPSLEAVKEDCQQIVGQIREVLLKDFEDEEKSSQDLTRNVSLLLCLDEPSDTLAKLFLDNALPKLLQTMESLKIANNPNVPMDEFMELSCGIFLKNLSLVIASFSQAFIQATELNEEARLSSQVRLTRFVDSLMDEFLTIMESRIVKSVQEANPHETESRETFLKALDRLYRRLVSMGTLLPTKDFSVPGFVVLSNVTKLDAEMSLQRMKRLYEKSVKESSNELRSNPGSFQEIHGSILATFVDQIKSGLIKLQDYFRSEFLFSQNADFRLRMAIVVVREGFVVESFKYLVKFGNDLIEENNYDSLIWLLLAKLYLWIEVSTIEYLVNNVESDFNIPRDRKSIPWGITNVADIAGQLNVTAKRLISEFVASQGNQLAELVKAAVIDKDLLGVSAEPEGPQIHMKRFVEILGKLDKYLDYVFPESDSSNLMRSERSSDSSKRSYSTLPSGGVSVSSGKTSTRPVQPLDPTMSSNIQKIFSEKVEIFGQIKHDKNAIIMCIVKIGLRAYLEFIRTKTIGKFGLHQIQVDLHYFQLYLWRFVNNEGVLHSLLDEILSSSIQRCVDPILLESTMVELIVEPPTERRRLLH